MSKKNVHEIPAGTICIYGTGSGGRNAFDEIAKARDDVRVVCFLDSFHDGSFLGLPVLTPKQLLASDIAYDYILVASAFSFEICVNLVEHGLTHYVRFYFTWDEPEAAPETHEQWEQRCLRERYALDAAGKLHLPQLDLNLTEHCNLACAGCNHFCPLAPPWFYDIDEAKRELEALSRLVSGIDRIFIVGGEPLLHPKVDEFFGLAKASYPGAQLYLWTNGKLLASMPERFWEKCREHGVQLRMTNYPQLRHKTPQIARLIKEKLGEFYGFDREDCCLMLTEKKIPNKSLSKCALEIITLSRGKIYHCPYEAYMHFYNAAFKADFPERQGYDIFTEQATPTGLRHYLLTPSRLCYNCRDKDDIVLVDWASSGKRADAWVLKESA